MFPFRLGFGTDTWHGQDFILVEDYAVSQPGKFHFITNFEWMKGESTDYGLSPSLMMTDQSNSLTACPAE